MPSAEWYDRAWCILIVVVVVLCAVIALVVAFGCNAVGRDQVLAQFDQRLVDLELAVDLSKKAGRDVNEPWTARILAAGVVLAFVIYLLVHRSKTARRLFYRVLKGNGKGPPSTGSPASP